MYRYKCITMQKYKVVRSQNEPIRNKMIFNFMPGKLLEAILDQIRETIFKQQKSLCEKALYIGNFRQKIYANRKNPKFDFILCRYF